MECRCRKLRKRYGRSAGTPVGSMGHLRIMEQARKAYRAARASGRTPRSAHVAAMNAVKYEVGMGAWDIANRVQKEHGE